MDSDNVFGQLYVYGRLMMTVLGRLITSEILKILSYSKSFHHLVHISGLWLWKISPKAAIDLSGTLEQAQSGKFSHASTARSHRMDVISSANFSRTHAYQHHPSSRGRVNQYFFLYPLTYDRLVRAITHPNFPFIFAGLSVLSKCR